MLSNRIKGLFFDVVKNNLDSLQEAIEYFLKQ